MTLTPIVERLSVELSLRVFTTWDCRGYDFNNQLSACKANAFVAVDGMWEEFWKDLLSNQKWRAKRQLINLIQSYAKLITEGILAFRCITIQLFFQNIVSPNIFKKGLH